MIMTHQAMQANIDIHKRLAGEATIEAQRVRRILTGAVREVHDLQQTCRELRRDLRVANLDRVSAEDQRNALAAMLVEAGLVGSEVAI